MDQALKDSQMGSNSIQRSEPYMSTDKMSNYINCFGCKPGKIVPVETTMIHDFIDTL
jgi:hypothetical protein